MKTIKSLPLKIKVVSLAAEAKLIHSEELRVIGFWKNATTEAHRISHHYAFTELKDHRCGIVREASRNTLLAYGFLRGRAYKEMENKRYSDPNWDEIERMVVRYGKQNQIDLKQVFERWKQEAGPIAE